MTCHRIIISDSLSDPDEQAANGAVLFLNIILKRHEIQTEAEMSQFVKSLLVKLRLVRGQQRSKCHAGILSLFVIAANQQPAMTIDKLLENRNLFKIVDGPYLGYGISVRGCSPVFVLVLSLIYRPSYHQ